MRLAMSIYECDRASASADSRSAGRRRWQRALRLARIIHVHRSRGEPCVRPWMIMNYPGWRKDHECHLLRRPCVSARPIGYKRPTRMPSASSEKSSDHFRPPGDDGSANQCSHVYLIVTPYTIILKVNLRIIIRLSANSGRRLGKWRGRVLELTIKSGGCVSTCNRSGGAYRRSKPRVPAEAAPRPRGRPAVHAGKRQIAGAHK